MPQQLLHGDEIDRSIKYRPRRTELGVTSVPDLPAVLDPLEIVTRCGIDLGMILHRAEQFIADVGRPT